MKVLLIGEEWQGKLTQSVEKGLLKNGCKVKILMPEYPVSRKYGILWKLPNYRKRKWKNFYSSFNSEVVNAVSKWKPDLVFVINESGIIETTVKYTVHEKKIPLAVWLCDDPFQYKHILTNLVNSTHVFTTERIVIPQLKQICQAKIVYLPLAVNPDLYRPVILTDEEKQIHGSDLVFLGNSWAQFSKGLYRGQILSVVADYDLCIYGDQGWLVQSQVFPELKGKIEVGTIPHKKTNIIYNSSSILLSIHHPQNKFAISSRTFDGGAAGIFQLCEYKKDLDLLFRDSGLVSFRSGDELREMVGYFLPRRSERRSIAERTRQIVVKKHTYKIRMSEMLNSVFD
jgi:spore maturation protein CgeB